MFDEFESFLQHSGRHYHGSYSDSDEVRVYLHFLNIAILVYPVCCVFLCDQICIFLFFIW